ncbi:MAG: histidinol-phosphatase, partial [Planctomycetota bacterium]
MDLHVHTCLSPCAEPEMTPQAIVRRAKERNLDVIAICDHNSAENVGAVKKAGASQGVGVLGGMEICSSEEVHILALFDNDEALFEMQTIVYDHLFGENDAKYFGEQLILDEHDEVVGTTDRLLIGSTTLGVSEIVETVGGLGGLGGLAVASH